MKWADFIDEAKSIVDRYRKEAPPGCDPKNIEGWAGVAIAVGAGALAYSASESSKSAAAANKSNAQNVSDTNQLNYQQFLQSRGSTGSAIYPIYAAPTEQKLYGDTLSVYDATGAIQPTAAQYQAISNGAAPGAAGASRAANDIFNGNTLNTELQQEAPVAAATTALAQTQKSSTLEALQQTLNSIKSIQAGKGYAGDSFGNSLLKFNATAGANSAGAQAIAGANLTNARTTQAIQENATNRELSNLSAPGTTAAQEVSLANLPSNAMEQNQVSRQNLFSNFKIGTSAPFQYQALPLVTPTASTGQIVAQGVGALAGGLGNYFANQSLASSLSAPTAGGGGSAFSAWNQITPSSLAPATPSIWE